MDISYSSKRAKLKTKQKVHPNAWNKNSRSIRENWTELREVQNELDRIEIEVKKVIKEFADKNIPLPPPKEFKSLLESRVFPTHENKIKDFREYFEEFIKYQSNRKNPKTGKPISKGTIGAYEQTLNNIIDFENDIGHVISFTNLSNKTYDLLCEYFENNKGYRPNTVGKHIKNLKSVFNHARNVDSVVLSNNYNEKYWVVIQTVKPAEEVVYLNEEELRGLEDLDLSNNRSFEISRDIFLIGAWTALRISDIPNLTIDHFDLKNGVINIKTEKTNTLVTIPIHPTVKRIIDKYNGSAPRLSEPIINLAIKEVCSKIESLQKTIKIKDVKGNVEDIKVFKKYELVSMHTSRRSFASNMYERRVPIQEIMAVTGHKKEENFYRYIGVSNNQKGQRLGERFKKWYS